MKVEDAVRKLEDLHEEVLEEEMSDSRAKEIVSGLDTFQKVKGIKGLDKPEAGKYLKGETIGGLRASLERYNKLVDEFNKKKAALNSIPDTQRGKEVQSMKSISKELGRLRAKIDKGSEKLASAYSSAKGEKRAVSAATDKAKEKAKEKAMAAAMVGKKPRSSKAPKEIKPKEKAYSILFGKNEDVFKNRVKSYLRG